MGNLTFWMTMNNWTSKGAAKVEDYMNMCSTLTLLLLTGNQFSRRFILLLLQPRRCFYRDCFFRKSPQTAMSLSIIFDSLLCFQDKVATESLPLLGFTVAPEKEEGCIDTVFHLYHKQTLFYSFRADDNYSAQR